MYMDNIATERLILAEDLAPKNLLWFIMNFGRYWPKMVDLEPNRTVTPL